MVAVLRIPIFVYGVTHLMRKIPFRLKMDGIGIVGGAQPSPAHRKCAENRDESQSGRHSLKITSKSPDFEV